MGLFAQSGWVTGVFLALLAMTIFILLRRTHRYLARQDKGKSPLARVPRPQSRDPGHHLDAPAEVVRWEVQMHDIARDLSAQLDTKFGALRTLIAEADRAAARLEAALAGKTDAAAPVDSRPATQAEGLRPGVHGPDLRVDQPGEPLRRPSARHRHEEVYVLADYGLSAAEIAGRLGSPVGEIELILGLRDKR